MAGADFDKKIRDFVRKAQGNFDLVVRSAMSEIFDEVVKASPVGNPSIWKRKKAPKGYAGGRFRGAWVSGVNSMPNYIPAGRDADGAATIAKLIATVPQRAAGNVYYLVNNLPYARKLEYGGHSSQVAVGGMVGNAVANWQRIVNASVIGKRKA